MNRNTPLGLWIQISSLFFFLAGIYSDLLLIRLFLVLANIFLLINGCLGSPLWPSLVNENSIQLDAIIWSALNIFVHLSSLIRLLLDERPVRLSDDEEALWRMFYRCGGLSKKIYQNTILSHFNVVQYKPGEELPTSTHFHILYRGTVQLNILERGELRGISKGHSGQAFDFKDMELLYDATPFESGIIKVKALTHVTLFQFSKSSIRSIAHTSKSIWQTLMIENLTRVVAKFIDPKLANAVLDDDYRHPFFLPLEKWEEPGKLSAGSGRALQSPFQHILATIHQSWALPWPFGQHPIGIRQMQLPEPPQCESFESFYEVVRTDSSQGSFRSHAEIKEIDEELGRTTGKEFK